MNCIEVARENGHMDFSKEIGSFESKVKKAYTFQKSDLFWWGTTFFFFYALDIKTKYDF